MEKIVKNEIITNVMRLKHTFSETGICNCLGFGNNGAWEPPLESDILIRGGVLIEHSFPG